MTRVDKSVRPAPRAVSIILLTLLLQECLVCFKCSFCHFFLLVVDICSLTVFVSVSAEMSLKNAVVPASVKIQVNYSCQQNMLSLLLYCLCLPNKYNIKCSVAELFHPLDVLPMHWTFCPFQWTFHPY